MILSRCVLLTLFLFIFYPVHSSRSASIPILTDITKESGIDFTHSFGDTHLSNIVESAGVGVALTDFDNDGNIDIYFVNGSYHEFVSHPVGREMQGKLTNALFRNTGNLTFENVTVQSGTGDTGYGMAALFGDLDNDGDKDLYITNFGRNTLLRNEGNGTFTDITKKAGVGCELWSLGVVFIDYNNDGYLDIYVGNYLEYDPDYRNFYPGDAFPGPLAYKGQPDVLYRNNGNMTFTDVTRESGLYNDTGRAMGVSAADIDNDGFMDIFVANDAMENFLYRNNGDGTFTNIALLSGTGFGQSGEATSAMSPEFGDLDNDGDIDILVADMDYSSLFINSGKGLFTEQSSVSGLARACGQYTSWSGNFIDYDGNGLLDIFITNGDPHFYEPEEDLLLLNMGNINLQDISTLAGNDFQQKRMGRGAATGDLDNDGDPDIVVSNLGDTPIIYRLDREPENWVSVKLVGTKMNSDAIGARLEVHSASAIQFREMVSSSGYLSQSDSRMLFPLSSETFAEKIVIKWPGGETETHNKVKANQHVTYVQPK